MKFKKYFKKKRKTGFTMIELLITISIVSLLAVISIFVFTVALQKGRDAQRKKDLSNIRVAFEDYYNDNNCYPDSTVLTNCGGDFSPYLKEIPCDPISNSAYYYRPMADQCDGYRVYAALESQDDPAIEKVGCDGVDACGWGSEYNYGIASGTTVYDPNGSGGSATPAPSPSTSPNPSPSTTIYEYACDSAGTCNRFEKGHPFLDGCPTTFQNPGCDGQCSNPIYWCN